LALLPHQQHNVSSKPGSLRFFLMSTEEECCLACCIIIHGDCCPNSQGDTCIFLQGLLGSDQERSHLDFWFSWCSWNGSLVWTKETLEQVEFSLLTGTVMPIHNQQGKISGILLHTPERTSTHHSRLYDGWCVNRKHFFIVFLSIHSGLLCSNHPNTFTYLITTKCLTYVPTTYLPIL